MEEVWKDIKGYEGLYQVSNLGNIKSLSRITQDKNMLMKIAQKEKENMSYIKSLVEK